jgi:hypothetical protein
MVEPLLPERSFIKVETATRKLRSYKSPGSDQIPTELIKEGGEIFILIYTNYLLYMEKEDCYSSKGNYYYTN